MDKQALQAVAATVAGVVRRDLANRYGLEAPFTLPPVSCDWFPAGGAFENRLVRIVPADGKPGFVSLTVKPFRSTEEDNIFDGATLAPDAPFGETAVLTAALVHDVLYCVKDELAAFAGVKERAVRDFADTLFREILLLLARRPWLARVYFLGVRIGYPFFTAGKAVRRWFLALAAAFVMLGGSGCQPLAPDPVNGHFVAGTTAGDVPAPAIVKEDAP